MAVSTFARSHQTYHALTLKFENFFSVTDGVKILELRVYQAEKKSLTICSPVYAIHECDRQTDRWIPADSKNRAYTYRSAVKKVII